MTTETANVSILDLLRKYWSELRQTDTLPARTKIDPVQIDDALPSSFILERADDGPAHLRVSGQRISEMVGFDTRGLPLPHLFDAPNRQRIWDLSDTCLAAPAVITLGIEAKAANGVGRVSGRMVLMPLADSDGTVNRALGGFELHSALPIAAECLIVPSSAAPKIEYLTEMPSIKERKPAPRPALRLVVDNT
ncbi:PAS domain-containing protein [Marivivens donghaensis]|uniref:PAS domain-containing protein n=1 Tax=Marivivens donghaensis TaxID=1699413 RepID=A0ABX0VZV7_9RHOB|nr:PAS domain-containing protein [Marivivens donghaensis]NIY72970.1 PAS domain-containing protein [Marivivens donghaensis]